MWYKYSCPLKTNNYWFVFFGQEHLENLPDVITRCLTQHQHSLDQRKNYLHPAAAATTMLPSQQPIFNASPIMFPHSRFVHKFFIIRTCKCLSWHLSCCDFLPFLIHKILHFHAEIYFKKRSGRMEYLILAFNINKSVIS